MELPPARRVAAIVYDVGSIGVPDLLLVDTLARLELEARRLGTTVELYNAGPALVDLIRFAGLDDVIVVNASRVEVDRQAKERKEVRLDEEVLRGDETT